MNLDPTVSVAAQTNGYATPSTYSHPSNDATIPRGTHNYDYHHPVAEAEYLGYEVSRRIPSIPGSYEAPQS
jgi:hypothetical protein